MFKVIDGKHKKHLKNSLDNIVDSDCSNSVAEWPFHFKYDENKQLTKPNVSLLRKNNASNSTTKATNFIIIKRALYRECKYQFDVAMHTFASP